MKKRVWKFHSWLGFAAGLGLLVIGLTGSLLVFNQEIDRLLGQAAPLVTPGSSHASLDQVVSAALALHPDLEIFAWYQNDAADRADWISGTLAKTGEGIKIFFDPYAGHLLETPPRQGAFTGWLLELHDSLLLGTPGLIFAGLLAVALMLSGLTGVYLYREFWWRFFSLRWRAGARIFFSDLHKTVGISSVGFNLILGFSGAYWNLSSAGDLLPRTESKTVVTKPAFPPRPIPLETMKLAAQTALPGFQPRGLRYPFDGDAYYNVRGAVPTPNPFASDYGNEVHFDPATGAITRIIDLRQAGAWAQFEDMLTPLHFGTFGGLPIKLLWCLGGLTPGILAVTGFILWRRRYIHVHP